MSRSFKKPNLRIRLRTFLSSLFFAPRKAMKNHFITKMGITRDHQDDPRKTILKALESIHEAKSNGDYDQNRTLPDIELGVNISIQTQNRGIAVVLAYVSDSSDIPGIEDRLGKVLDACKPICMKLNRKYSYMVITLGIGAFVTLLVLLVSSTNINHPLRNSIANFLTQIFRP